MHCNMNIGQNTFFFSHKVIYLFRPLFKKWTFPYLSLIEQLLPFNHYISQANETKNKFNTLFCVSVKENVNILIVVLKIWFYK